MKFFTSCLFFISLNLFAVETVPYVDINRYMGTWYEIASYEQEFQKGCFNTTAHYELQTNGEVKVINQCLVGFTERKLKKAQARAWVVDPDTNAKLKVQFFFRTIRIPRFAGNYWIIDLDEKKYSYAVVSDPTKQYLWILSRTKVMNPVTYFGILNRLKEKGYDLGKLKTTWHL